MSTSGTSIQVGATTESPPFTLLTALSWSPHPTLPPFSLLPRHLHRLKTAHAALAAKLPLSWCAKTPFPTEERIVEELERCVKAGGETMQRVRLVIDEQGNPHATSAPLVPMPSYPIRLVFDSQPLDYTDPFLLHKTTYRGIYDDARLRHGATLHADAPPSAPFDVILFNTSNELTESTIANIALRLDKRVSEEWITPLTSCGLLPGVQRAELLERGEVVEGVVRLEEALRAVEAGTLEVRCFNAVRGVYEGYVEAGGGEE